jgi:Cu2+-exporting ATPase
MALAEALPSVAAPATAPACAHCGLPVPAGEPGDDDGTAFCCAGCRAAFRILHDGGLERYYRLAQRRERPVIASGRGFEEFDHPAFHALYVRARPDGMRETELYLEGVHCASCVWLVERVPLLLPGMARAELDVERSRVRVSWDATRTSLSAIARTLDTLGYRPHPFRGVHADAMRRAEDRAMLARIGVAGAIAMNVMLAALALYSGNLSGMEAPYVRYFRWVSLIVTTPALLYPGRVFFRGAWAALRARTLHMDLPIALALLAGYARGAVNTVTDRGPIYFDGVAALIFLLLVGRFLQQRAQRAAVDAAELLHALAPASARRIDADGVRDVPLEALLPGMTIEVRAGDTLAADGVVIAGQSELDLSLLTGEPRPVPAAAGTRVHAGTVNRRATLRVRVEQTGEATRLGHILRDVAAGAARRAPVVLLADRLAGGFVAVVLALAAATAWWWMGRDPSRAIDHAIALLIVTCPCALALATPLAVTVAIGRAARAGILIRGGDALERLAQPGRLVLDKTGTVTAGRSTLVAWEGEAPVKPLVVALEREATHPVAAGFLAAWPDVPAPAARGVEHSAGGGLTGAVMGRRVVVGSPAFVRARLAPGGDRLAPFADPALTPVLVAVDGVTVARAGFGDPLRPEAAAAVAALRRRGWRPSLLSGDDPAVVAAVGARLGLDPAECRGGVSPEQKLAAIDDLAGREPVVMVGDGINDAAAIARADVGIGVRGGAEACLAAADVFLAREGIGGLVTLMAGARRTRDLIRRNVAFSLVYNAAGAALAMTGVITPWMAALLMPASSITVVLTSWKSRTFEEAGR